MHTVKPPNVVVTTNRLDRLRLQIMASDLARIVGRQIRARRLAAGMHRQRELAEKMESPTISNQTISDWERGVNKPSDEHLRELAAILECEVSDFYAEITDASTPDALAALDGPL